MKSFAVLLLLALGALASANPDIWDSYRAHYRFVPGSDADKAKCMNCHTQVPEHNGFGKFVKQTLKKAGIAGKPPDDFWLLTEATDSDGDGFTNGEEAKTGTNAGDPASHPASRPSSAPAPVANSSESPLVPRHTFHPVIVHFPIALFIFGAFLEFLGRYRRDDVVRGVGFWNLVFGTLATAAAIPTGFIAALRLGYPLTVGTPVFTHLALGIAATLLMLGVVLWRRLKIVNHPAYWCLLAIAAAVVGLAGHFGGQMVYG